MSEVGVADAVIVGAGIIGLACALELARDGLRTVVLEQHSAVGMGTSRSGQGGVGIGFGLDDWGLEWHRLAMQSYAEFAATGVDISYRRRGGLIVASSEGAVAECRAGADRLAAFGLDAEFLDAQELRAAEPALAESVLGAVRVGEFGELSPLRVVATLADLCREAGVEILVDALVTDIATRNGAVSAVTTRHGAISTPLLCIACGRWSREVGNMAGIDIPVWPLKGHLLVSEPLPANLLRHYISSAEYGEAVLDESHDHLTQAGPPPSSRAQVATVLQAMPTGPVLIGSSREFAGLDERPNPATMDMIARKAIALVPALAEAAIVRAFVGFRPWTPDGHPLIGPVANVPGLFLATGHGGDGTTGALLTGRILADQIAGRDPVISLAPVAADRFSRRSAA